MCTESARERAGGSAGQSVPARGTAGEQGLQDTRGPQDGPHRGVLSRLIGEVASGPEAGREDNGWDTVCV